MDTKPARRRGPLRTLAGAVLVLGLVVVVGVVGAGLVVQQRLDQDGLRQRVEREVLRQTGRALTLDTLHVRLLPVPTLQADGIALANWPGHGRPEMLTAASATAHLALLPLLHHVVRLEGVTLIHPDLLLQRDADGTANWQMHKAVVPDAGTSSGGGGGARWQVEIGSVRLRDGAVAWHDALKGWSGQVALDRLDGSGLAGGHPSVTLAGRHGGAGFDADLATGPLERLEAVGAAGSPWPLRVSARERAGGREMARLGIAGTVADPARGRGFVLDVTGQASQLGALNALFPHAALPAVDGLSLRARVSDSGGDGRPVLQSLSLRTGAFAASALVRSRWVRNLSVRSLSVQATAPGAPMAVALEGSWRGQDTALHGTAGSLSGWQAGASAVPVSLELSVGDARARVDGTAGRSASDLRLSVQAPALQRVLGTGPALTNFALTTRLQVGPVGQYSASDLRLESRELDLNGSGTVQASAHPVVTATIGSSHADLDALRAGWKSPWQDKESTAPGPSPPPPAPAPAPAPVPASAPASAPGEAVPFAALRLADLAVRLDAREIRLGGALYRNLSARLAVQGGKLSLAPFSVAGPAGPVTGQLDADASARSVALKLDPAMVPAETLALLAGVGPALSGAVELVGDLHGTGDTAEALAGSLAGQAGVSLVDGSVANEALSQVVGRSVGSPGGRTAVRCLALPAQVQDGVAVLSTLALQTSRLDVQGHGTVGLRDGRLDLHLLPRLSLGAGGVSLPVHVGGTLGAPSPMFDPAAPGGRFALVIGPNGPAPDLCGPALQAARFGTPGPQPGPMAPDRPRKVPKPIDILRGLGLFR